MGTAVLTLSKVPGLAAEAAARGLALVPGDQWRRAYAALVPAGVAPPSGWPGVLIVMVGASDDLAAALDAGAQDAVTVGTSASEIAARLAARLRDRPAPLSFGPLRIDPIARCVTRDGRALPLLPREYALLLHLAHAFGRCVSREELLAEIWGLRFDPGTNLVAVHASRLRAKLDRGHAVAMLRTEKGRGYRLAYG